jgi:hypothetical protein
MKKLNYAGKITETLNNTACRCRGIGTVCGNSTEN